MNKIEMHVSSFRWMYFIPIFIFHNYDYGNKYNSDIPFQGAAKVSILMIGQQAIMDAYLCLLHLTAGILVGKFST